MKRKLLLVLATCLAAGVLWAQASSSGRSGFTAAAQSSTVQTTTQSSPGANNTALKGVLDAMDRASSGFKSAEVHFVWDQYTQVVNAHDMQYGVMYIRHHDHETQMAAQIWPAPRTPQNVKEPPDKYVLYANGKVQLYQPKIEQVTQYTAGKNKQAFESFLVLGFGGSGRDLQSQFEVSYAGEETVGNVKTAKLSLTPRSPTVRNMFNPIVLWIDPARGVSVQQQFFEPNSGDYRLARYSDIQLNQSVPDSVFKLKTSGKTKYVSPGA